MIRLRDAKTKEVVELDEHTRVCLIDGLHYIESRGEVKRIGAMTKLRDLRAFETVEVDTGFDDQVQPRIMTILPKHTNGVAAFVAAMAVGLSSLGCTGTTYHYSYTCYGQGCVPPATIGYMPQQVLPQQAHVQYVNRPVEIHMRRDGTIDTRDFQRRAAQPRRRAQ